MLTRPQVKDVDEAELISVVCHCFYLAVEPLEYLHEAGNDTFPCYPPGKGKAPNELHLTR
jgi:hypothetical protein